MSASENVKNTLWCAASKAAELLQEFASSEPWERREEFNRAIKDLQDAVQAVEESTLFVGD